MFSECSNGTFGYNCTACSGTCRDGACKKFSEKGTSPDGCEVGYQGETCDQG